MPITNFELDSDRSRAVWNNNGSSIEIEKVKDASCDLQKNFVATLSIENDRNVEIYDETGILMTSLSLPEDYVFQYFLEDESYGVRAICSGFDTQNNRLDWFFKIDLKEKKLIKQGRAY